MTSETVTESTVDNMDSDGEISIPQQTLVQSAPDQMVSYSGKPSNEVSSILDIVFDMD